MEGGREAVKTGQNSGDEKMEVPGQAWWLRWPGPPKGRQRTGLNRENIDYGNAWDVVREGQRGRNGGNGYR